VLFDMMVVKQLHKPLARLVPTYNTSQGHACTKTCGQHGDRSRATKSVFLLVHTDDYSRLLGIELRRVTDQVAI